MKGKFTLLLFFVSSLFFQPAFSQTADPRATVYATITSGNWDVPAIWETYSTYAAAIAATPGSGTAATGVPSGTHNVLIRNGHTVSMNAANRGCKSIIVQTGGKLWANELQPTARRLQIGQGGTGFVYPLTDTVQVDGTLGGANDALYIETGVTTQNVKLSGSGSIDIGRIRTIGGTGPSAGGVLNFSIDADVNLWVPGNYGLTLVYNPTVTDNYTMTIQPGRTVSMKTATTTFHNSQNATTYGQYTYNVQGILDLAGTTATSSVIAPAPAASKITLNINGGTLKPGTAFKADTSMAAPVSAGVLDFRLVNGGIVDATATTGFNVRKTTDGAGGVRDLIFAADATSNVKQTVSSTQVKFPVGLSGSTTTNTAYVTNSGTADVFTVLLKSTIDNAPPNATKVVNRQWTINEAVAGGSSATVALSWVAADQGSGFNPASSVAILRWNGSAYTAYAATVTGSGTANDPYVATTASGAVTAFSPFIVANFTVTPAPVNFTGAKAFAKNNGVQVEWTTAIESEILRYVVEKSTDGTAFTQAGTVAANNTTSSSYSWFDATPSAGANYYRIKTVEASGSKQTAILKVSIGKSAPGMVIASNPVKGGIINLQVSGLPKGSFRLNVYNNAGQQVLQKTITAEGSSLAQSLELPAALKGIYTVQLQSGTIMLTKQIVVE